MAPCLNLIDKLLKLKAGTTRWTFIGVEAKQVVEAPSPPRQIVPHTFRRCMKLLVWGDVDQKTLRN